MCQGLLRSNLMRIPYIYDFDDAFFLKYRRNKLRHLSFLLKGKFQPVISRASAILAGNRHLATYANRFNPATTLLPTVVDLNRYAPLRSKRDAVFTVGWIGSPSTSVYLSAWRRPWLNWVERADSLRSYRRPQRGDRGGRGGKLALGRRLRRLNLSIRSTLGLCLCPMTNGHAGSAHSN